MVIPESFSDKDERSLIDLRETGVNIQQLLQRIRIFHQIQGIISWQMTQKNLCIKEMKLETKAECLTLEWKSLHKPKTPSLEFCFNVYDAFCPIFVLVWGFNYLQLRKICCFNFSVSVALKQGFCKQMHMKTQVTWLKPIFLFATCIFLFWVRNK